MHAELTKDINAKIVDSFVFRTVLESASAELRSLPMIRTWLALEPENHNNERLALRDK